jgi:aldehyde:ferredoxin oxidoreductase
MTIEGREMSDAIQNLRIFRINVTNRTRAEEAVSESILFLGGRAFTSRWISSHVNPECTHLGGKNQLVISPGLLAGTQMRELWGMGNL